MSGALRPFVLSSLESVTQHSFGDLQALLRDLPPEALATVLSFTQNDDPTLQLLERSGGNLEAEGIALQFVSTVCSRSGLSTSALRYLLRYGVAHPDSRNSILLAIKNAAAHRSGTCRSFWCVPGAPGGSSEAGPGGGAFLSLEPVNSWAFGKEWGVWAMVRVSNFNLQTGPPTRACPPGDDGTGLGCTSLLRIQGSTGCRLQLWLSTGHVHLTLVEPVQEKQTAAAAVGSAVGGLFNKLTAAMADPGRTPIGGAFGSPGSGGAVPSGLTSTTVTAAAPGVQQGRWTAVYVHHAQKRGMFGQAFGSELTIAVDGSVVYRSGPEPAAPTASGASLANVAGQGASVPYPRGLSSAPLTAFRLAEDLDGQLGPVYLFREGCGPLSPRLLTELAAAHTADQPVLMPKCVLAGQAAAAASESQRLSDSDCGPFGNGLWAAFHPLAAQVSAGVQRVAADADAPGTHVVATTDTPLSTSESLNLVKSLVGVPSSDGSSACLRLIGMQGAVPLHMRNVRTAVLDCGGPEVLLALFEQCTVTADLLCDWLATLSALVSSSSLSGYHMSQAAVQQDGVARLAVVVAPLLIADGQPGCTLPLSMIDIQEGLTSAPVDGDVGTAVWASVRVPNALLGLLHAAAAHPHLHAQVWAQIVCNLPLFARAHPNVQRSLFQGLRAVVRARPGLRRSDSTTSGVSIHTLCSSIWAWYSILCGRASSAQDSTDKAVTPSTTLTGSMPCPGTPALCTTETATHLLQQALALLACAIGAGEIADMSADEDSWSDVAAAPATVPTTAATKVLSTSTPTRPSVLGSAGSSTGAGDKSNLLSPGWDDVGRRSASGAPWPVDGGMAWGSSSESPLTTTEAQAILSLALMAMLQAVQCKEAKQAGLQARFEDLCAGVLSLAVGVLDYDCSHVTGPLASELLAVEENAQANGQISSRQISASQILLGTRFFGARAAFDAASGGDGLFVPLLLFGVLPQCTCENMRAVTIRAVLHGYRACAGRAPAVTESLLNAATAVGKTVGKTLLKAVGAAKEIGSEMASAAGQVQQGSLPLKIAAALGKAASMALDVPTSSSQVGEGSDSGNADSSSTAVQTLFGGSFWSRAFNRAHGWDVLYHLLAYRPAQGDSSIALRQHVSPVVYSALWEGVLLPDCVELLLRAPGSGIGGGLGDGPSAEAFSAAAGLSADATVTPSGYPSPSFGPVRGSSSGAALSEEVRALALMACIEHAQDRVTASNGAGQVQGAWVQDWRDVQAPAPLRPVLSGPPALLLLFRLLPNMPPTLALRCLLDVSHLLGTATGEADENESGSARGSAADTAGQRGRPSTVFLARCQGWELRLGTYLLGFNGHLRPLPTARPLHVEVDALHPQASQQASLQVPSRAVVEATDDSATWDAVYAAGERLLRALLRRSLSDARGWRPFQRLLALLPLAAVAGTPASMISPVDTSRSGSNSASIPALNVWLQAVDTLPPPQAHGARLLAWLFAACVGDFDSQRTRNVTKANLENLIHITALVEPYVCGATPVPHVSTPFAGPSQSSSSNRTANTIHTPSVGGQISYASAVLTRVLGFWDTFLVTCTDSVAERYLSYPCLSSALPASGDLRAILLSFTWESLRACPPSHSEAVRALARLVKLLGGVVKRANVSFAEGGNQVGGSGQGTGADPVSSEGRGTSLGQSKAGDASGDDSRLDGASRASLGPEMVVYHALIHLHALLSRAKSEANAHLRLLAGHPDVGDASSSLGGADAAKIALDRLSATTSLCTDLLLRVYADAPSLVASAHVSVSRLLSFLDGFQTAKATAASLRTALLNRAEGARDGIREQEQDALALRTTWQWLVGMEDTGDATRQSGGAALATVDWISDPGWSDVVGQAAVQVTTVTRTATQSTVARVRRTWAALLHIFRSDAQPMTAITASPLAAWMLSHQQAQGHEEGGWVVVPRMDFAEGTGAGGVGRAPGGRNSRSPSDADQAPGAKGGVDAPAAGGNFIFSGFEKIRRGVAKGFEQLQQLAAAVEADAEAESVLEALEGVKGSKLDVSTDMSMDESAGFTVGEAGEASALLLPYTPAQAAVPLPLPPTNPPWYLASWTNTHARARHTFMDMLHEATQKRLHAVDMRRDGLEELQQAHAYSLALLRAPGAVLGQGISSSSLCLPKHRTRFSLHVDRSGAMARLEYNPLLIDYAPAAYEKVNEAPASTHAAVEQLEEGILQSSAPAGDDQALNESSVNRQVELDLLNTSSAAGTEAGSGTRSDDELPARPATALATENTQEGPQDDTRTGNVQDGSASSAPDAPSQSSAKPPLHASATRPSRDTTEVAPGGPTATDRGAQSMRTGTGPGAAFADAPHEESLFITPCLRVTVDRNISGTFRLTTTHLMFEPTRLGGHTAAGSSDGSDSMASRVAQVQAETAAATAQAAGVTSPHGPAGSPRAFTGLPQPVPQRWRVALVTRVLPRRYLLRRSALEIYFDDGSSVLLAFTAPGKTKDGIGKAASDVAEALWAAANSGRAPLLHAALLREDARRTLVPSKLARATRAMSMWQAREMTNFEYLMELNSLAGRSYHDLTQYPVLPWVLCDYTSDALDLSASTVYRDLTKPIGALNAERLDVYKERMEGMASPTAHSPASGRRGDVLGPRAGLGALFAGLSGRGAGRGGKAGEFAYSLDPSSVPPFLYGSHYSNAGSVLYYMLRTEPFTRLAVELQSGRFDVPDRLFDSVSACWHGVTHAMSDVKELAPQWYTCPSIFVNNADLPLGNTQSAEPVGDVKLPPWACGSPHLFVWLNRLALESDFVSDQLHHWIDLVFGYKQRGQAAVDADNVFYYLTYEDSVDIDSATASTTAGNAASGTAANAGIDPVLKEAIEAQIASFGQTPAQLFTRAHPSRLKRDASGGGSMSAIGLSLSVPLPLFGFTSGTPLFQQHAPTAAPARLFAVPTTRNTLPVWFTGLQGPYSQLVLSSFVGASSVAPSARSARGNSSTTGSQADAGESAQRQGHGQGMATPSRWPSLSSQLTTESARISVPSLLARAGPVHLLDVSENLRVFTAAPHPRDPDHALLLAERQAKVSDMSSESEGGPLTREDIEPAWAVTKPFTLSAARNAASLDGSLHVISSLPVPGSSTTGTAQRLFTLYGDGVAHLHKWDAQYSPEGLPFMLRVDNKGRPVVRLPCADGGGSADLDASLHPLPLHLPGLPRDPVDRARLCAVSNLTCKTLVEMYTLYGHVMQTSSSVSLPSTLQRSTGGLDCCWAVPPQAHVARTALTCPRAPASEMLLPSGSVSAGGPSGGGNSAGAAAFAELLLMFSCGYADGSLRWASISVGSSQGVQTLARTKVDSWVPSADGYGGSFSDVTCVSTCTELRFCTGTESLGYVVTGHTNGHAHVWRVVWNTPTDVAAAAACVAAPVPVHARTRATAAPSLLAEDGVPSAATGQLGGSAAGSVEAAVILHAVKPAALSGSGKRHRRGVPVSEPNQWADQGTSSGNGGPSKAVLQASNVPDSAACPAVLVKMCSLASSPSQPVHASATTAAACEEGLVLSGAPVTVTAASGTLAVAFVGRLDGSVACFDLREGYALSAWSLHDLDVPALLQRAWSRGRGIGSAGAGGARLAPEIGHVTPVQHILPLPGTGHAIIHWRLLCVPAADISAEAVPLSLLACVHVTGEVMSVTLVEDVIDCNSAATNSTDIGSGMPVWVTSLAASGDGTAVLVGCSTGCIQVRHALTLACGGYVACHTDPGGAIGTEGASKGGQGAFSSPTSGAAAVLSKNISLAQKQAVQTHKQVAATARQVAAKAKGGDMLGALSAMVAGGSGGGEKGWSHGMLSTEPTAVFPATAVTSLHIPERENTVMAGCADGRLVIIADASKARKDLASALLSNFV